jgi:hypothetical protein
VALEIETSRRLSRGGRANADLAEAEAKLNEANEELRARVEELQRQTATSAWSQR